MLYCCLERSTRPNKDFRQANLQTSNIQSNGVTQPEGEQMTNLVEYKAVNEDHLTIGEKFIKRVLKELGKDLDIASYAVDEGTWSSTEAIKLKVGDKLSLRIELTHSK